MKLPAVRDEHLLILDLALMAKSFSFAIGAGQVADGSNVFAVGPGTRGINGGVAVERFSQLPAEALTTLINDLLGRFQEIADPETRKLAIRGLMSGLHLQGEVPSALLDEFLVKTVELAPDLVATIKSPDAAKALVDLLDAYNS